MRLSFRQSYELNSKAITNAQEKLNDASARLEKQTKILTPADDPSGIARVVVLEQQIAAANQYKTNSDNLRNSLDIEESVLSSIQESVTKAKTLVISLGSGGNSQIDRVAIADQLKNIRDEIFDLMNQKDSTGGYLFSGFAESTQPFVANQTTGYYDFKGDEGQKYLQISPSVTVAANDSGKRIFQNVGARNTTINLAVGGNITQGKVQVSSQTVFDQFYQQKYDSVTPANNDYRVSYAVPDQYQITLQNGSPLAPPVSGTAVPGQAISFNGLTIEHNGTFPGTLDFSLKPPAKSNILNTLTDLYQAVVRDQLVPMDLKEKLIDATVQLDKAALNVADAISAIGGRQNLISSIAESNEDLKIANTKYRADIYEIDLIEGMTELSKQETLLKIVQSSFTKVTGMSLFDYMR